MNGGDYYKPSFKPVSWEDWTGGAGPATACTCHPDAIIYRRFWHSDRRWTKMKESLREETMAWRARLIAELKANPNVLFIRE